MVGKRMLRVQTPSRCATFELWPKDFSVLLTGILVSPQQDALMISNRPLAVRWRSRRPPNMETAERGGSLPRQFPLRSDKQVSDCDSSRSLHSLSGLHYLSSQPPPRALCLSDIAPDRYE